MWQKATAAMIGRIVASGRCIGAAGSVIGSVVAIAPSLPRAVLARRAVRVNCPALGPLTRGRPRRQGTGATRAR